MIEVVDSAFRRRTTGEQVCDEPATLTGVRAKGA
jgi:hypothetical protein